MGATTVLPAVKLVLSVFQSTLPWWERLGLWVMEKLDINVSIHAPVVGATKIQLLIMHLFQVSIHAPVVGATASDKSLAGLLRSFNPRSRGGSDFKAVQFA